MGSEVLKYFKQQCKHSLLYRAEHHVLGCLFPANPDERSIYKATFPCFMKITNLARKLVPSCKLLGTSGNAKKGRSLPMHWHMHDTLPVFRSIWKAKSGSFPHIRISVSAVGMHWDVVQQNQDGPDSGPQCIWNYILWMETLGRNKKETQQCNET